jgi:hypothetical protein
MGTTMRVKRKVSHKGDSEDKTTVSKNVQIYTDGKNIRKIRIHKSVKNSKGDK